MLLDRWIAGQWRKLSTVDYQQSWIRLSAKPTRTAVPEILGYKLGANRLAQPYFTVFVAEVKPLICKQG